VALAACLGAIALLSLAASRPGGRGEQTIVFVVDVSASMSGRPLDDAKAYVFREIASLGPNGRVAIVTAGARARIALPLSRPGPASDAALRALRAEPEVAAVPEALALAHALGGRVVLLTDQALPDAHVLPHATRDNVGITSFFTRAAPDATDEEDREASITLATSSEGKRRARLVVTLAGRVLADRVVEVPTVERVGVRGAGRLVARVAPLDGKADALAIDDEANLEERPHRPARVALYGADTHPASAFFVEHALRAAGVTAIDRTAPWSGAEVAVVLAAGADRPRGMPTLYVGVEPDLGFETRTVEKSRAHLRSVATEEPMMRGIALDEITVLRSKVAVSPPSTMRSLVDLDAGPAMLRGGVGPELFVWLGIDPEGSDLVLRVAFPVLVANALADLGGRASVVAAKTTPIAETQLRGGAAPRAGTPAVLWKLAPTPAVLLALLAALLLVFEAWISRERRSLA